MIAGPIVHHGEVLPQFKRRLVGRDRSLDLPVGLTMFTVGLFKKVVIADTIATFATPVFAAADSGLHPSAAEAWCATLAYTFQIYFDFSGYCDMAIGAARMFGIQLPLNFDSPYKATSVIDFWRRWHMTLARFLRDYLYFPLGGNRRGPGRRYVNLMITMLLGGLWHGAGWTFVFWGALHGAYLIVNHAFQACLGSRSDPTVPPAGDTAARMRWFWDASHFTDRLGDDVIRRTLRASAGGAAAFGVRIDPSNVEAHLRAIRAGRESYASNHPKEIAFIADLAGKAGIGSTVETASKRPPPRAR